MRDLTSRNFGLLIAFVLPGFTALWGATHLSEDVRAWLFGNEATGPTVGGFLYVTLFSVAAGVTASTIRWFIIDTVHHRTGLKTPDWDFSNLHHKVTAYDALIENHYRYYQFHANCLVSAVFVLIARRFDLGLFVWTLADLGIIALLPVLWIGSRDTLRKYFSRLEGLLGTAR